MEVRASKKRGRPPGRKAIAPGSLEDRIVEILKEAGEPVGRKVIEASAKADPYAISLALKDLVHDARVTKTGVRAGTKYSVR